MMRIGIISGVLGLCFALAVHAQKSDSSGGYGVVSTTSDEKDCTYG